MEFPELGKNCNKSDCKSLDFLPITCSFCSNVFCKDHFLPISHECQMVVQPQAPLNEGSKQWPCTYTGCTVSELVEMLCVKCGQHFCLSHRYHSCFTYTEEEILEAQRKLNKPREEFQKSLEQVNSKLDSSLEKSIKSGKNQQTALKVQLMRLKGKAVGQKTVPTADRIYFLIYQPLSVSTIPKAVFVSKDWSVGRTIDSIATSCLVPNRNNESNAKKLRLFKKCDGKPVSTNMSELISNLLNVSTIVNGDSLILELVDPNQSLENFELTNVKNYGD